MVLLLMMWFWKIIPRMPVTYKLIGKICGNSYVESNYAPEFEVFEKKR